MFLEENNDEEEGVLVAERQIRGVSRWSVMLNTFILKKATIFSFWENLLKIVKDYQYFQSVTQPMDR